MYCRIGNSNPYKASITILHVLFEDKRIDTIAIFCIGRKEWLKIKKRAYDDARNLLIGKKRENIAIKERDCDIIVMGCHGQGALADAVTGSNARRVLRRSQKPVFVVPLSKKG